MGDRPLQAVRDSGGHRQGIHRPHGGHVVEKREAVKRECARAKGVGSGERKARTAKRIHRPKVAAEGSR